MNKGNNWDHVTAASMVEGPIKNDTHKEMAIIKVMKQGKAAGPSEICAEMISGSGEIGVSVMVELCQGVLDGREMPDEWQTNVLVPRTSKTRTHIAYVQPLLAKAITFTVKLLLYY